MRNIALAVALFIAILIISFSSWQSGFGQGRDKGYAEGVESGKGALLEPTLETTYELKLVGVSNGKCYQMEGTPLALQSYGSSGPQMTTLPSGAKAGDTLVMFSEGYRKVEKP